MRAADWLLDGVLSLAVDAGLGLVTRLNAPWFVRGTVPGRGILLSRRLTATSRRGKITENHRLLGRGQSPGLCGLTSPSWLGLRTSGVSRSGFPGAGNPAWNRLHSHLPEIRFHLGVGSVSLAYRGRLDLVSGWLAEGESLTRIKLRMK